MISQKCFQSTGTITARSDNYEINRINLLKEKRKELIDRFRRVKEKQKINPVYGSIIKSYADYFDIERTQKQQQHNALIIIINHMDDAAAAESEGLDQCKFDQREILDKINELEKDIIELENKIK
jgi:hypothetical protein